MDNRDVLEIRGAVDGLIASVGVAKAAEHCRVAGVLFTYRCTICCKHCLFGSAPDRPPVAMTAGNCVDALRMLHETGRVVHVAGGEAMLYWDILADALRMAAGLSLAPHFIETNCSFACDDEIVRDRLEFLAAHGVMGVYASADPFHQEFVPAERFLRVRRIAISVFGERNFWGSMADENDIRGMEDVARDPVKLREYARRNPPMMVGTAQGILSRYLDRHDTGSGLLPGNKNCRAMFQRDTLWELHIDPYGNIQTNCGIILGRTDCVTPRELLLKGPENANRFVSMVCDSGPRGLAEWARREHGFDVPESVTQACELCYLVRRFLHGLYPGFFGPREIYF